MVDQLKRSSIKPFFFHNFICTCKSFIIIYTTFTIFCPQFGGSGGNRNDDDNGGGGGSWGAGTGADAGDDEGWD